MVCNFRMYVIFYELRKHYEQCEFTKNSTVQFFSKKINFATSV